MTISQNTEEEKIPSVDPIESEDPTSEENEAERENREDSRFKEGQILRFVRVRFPGNSRSFAFLIGKRRIEYGQKVVAMSDRGMAVGYVNSFPYDVPFNKSMLPVRSISKLADDEDSIKDKEAYRQQKNAENICNDLIEQHKLDMYLTHVEFTSFGKKAVFYFIAPSRVDFRDLVRELVGKLKTRIELRQISVRDRSAAVGGIGPCGLELCCSSFLTKYGNVGIKMAKNQDLTLNFSKLNGVCGQLKCCLQYEDDVYREKRSRLPKEGDFIHTHTGESGRVDRLHLLSEQFDMMTNRGVRKRYVVDLYKETTDKDGAKFPNEFEFVSDETQKIVGMDEAEAKKVKAFEAEIEAMKAPAKNFADDIFENLFGAKTLDYSLPEVLEPTTGPAKKVKTPDDEEELVYTPTDEDRLDNEDDDDRYDMEVTTTTVKAAQDGNRDNNNRNRNSSHQGRDNRPQGNQGNRNNNQGPRQPQQNRGPNPNQGQQQNRGPNPNQGQNNNRGPNPNRRPR
ncbi:MAG: regulatory iron-sulfur-containing complex subunit RicT [Bdellovibrionota bacterium]